MFDFVLQLREALTDQHLRKLGLPGQVDDAARDAAYCVAVALGRCRAAMQALPPDIEGTLDAPTAVAASEHGRWLVEWLKIRFTELIDESLTPEKNDEFADEDARCSLVHTRHELWAATNSIQNADDVLAAEGKCPQALTEQLTLLIEETAALDAMLITHADELAPAAEFPLLKNLRRSVKDTRQTVPWWLEGTIESAAERRMTIFLNTLPDPKLIERRVQARASNAMQTPGQHERDPIALVARLLSGLTVSHTAPAGASSGDVSAQITAIPEGDDRFLTVSISCKTSGRQPVDWDAVPVRLESLHHEGSRYYCTLDDHGCATLLRLPVSTYRIRAWRTGVSIDDPGFDESPGRSAEAPRPRVYRSHDGKLRASVSNSVLRVVNPDASLAGAVIGYVLVAGPAHEDRVPGEVIVPEQELVLEQSGSTTSCEGRVYPAVQRPTLVARAESRKVASTERLIIYLEP